MEMTAIKILMDEHQLILKGMDVAEAMAGHIRAGLSADVGHVGKLADFITAFADEFHHKKEEDILFKWMAERGFPVEGGPIAIMLMEHDVGRQIIADMRPALLAGGCGKDADIIAQSLSGFSAHLRQHIFKEDNILYPMAERLADDDSDRELLRRFAEKIPDATAATTRDKYDRLITELAAIYVK